MTASFMTLNATLLVELVVFVVVLGVMARFVIRPLQAAMDRRQAEIDQADAKAQRIEELLASAEAEYDATLAAARREANQLIEAGRRVGSYLEQERPDPAGPHQIPSGHHLVARPPARRPTIRCPPGREPRRSPENDPSGDAALPYECRTTERWKRLDLHRDARILHEVAAARLTVPRRRSRRDRNRLP